MDYIDNLNITKEKFFKDTGLSASNFKGKGAKSELGGDKIVKILTVFPDLSPKWLLTGEGPPLVETNSNCKQSSPELPPGPCQQCSIREKLITQQEETIELLKEKVDHLKGRHRKKPTETKTDPLKETG